MWPIIFLVCLAPAFGWGGEPGEETKEQKLLKISTPTPENNEKFQESQYAILSNYQPLYNNFEDLLILDPVEIPLKDEFKKLTEISDILSKRQKETLPPITAIGLRGLDLSTENLDLILGTLKKNKNLYEKVEAFDLSKNNFAAKDGFMFFFKVLNKLNKLYPEAYINLADNSGDFNLWSIKFQDYIAAHQVGSLHPDQNLTENLLNKIVFSFPAQFPDGFLSSDKYFKFRKAWIDYRDLGYAYKFRRAYYQQQYTHTLNNKKKTRIKIQELLIDLPNTSSDILFNSSMSPSEKTKKEEKTSELSNRLGRLLGDTTLDLSESTLKIQKGCHIVEDILEGAPHSISISQAIKQIEHGYHDQLPMITKLNLKSNWIGSEGIKTLVTFILKNLTNLHILDLSQNHIRADYSFDLIPLLLQNNFKYVDIVGNTGYEVTSIVQDLRLALKELELRTPPLPALQEGVDFYLQKIIWIPERLIHDWRITDVDLNDVSPDVIKAHQAYYNTYK